MKPHNLSAKFLGTLSLILMTCFVIVGQQENLYTQYLFNSQSINPAYVGSWKRIGFIAMSRYQWLGIDNAPSTQSFSFQMPFKKENIALGLNINNDVVGLEKRFSVFGDYSYKLKAGVNTDLRLGLKFGFTNYSNPLSNYSLVDPNDPLFTGGDLNSKFIPNFGFGIILTNPKYYIGLSAPKVLTPNIGNNINNYSLKSETTSYFFQAGYVFDLTQDIKFKPTIVGQYSPNYFAGFGITANILLKEKFWIGAMYRSGNALGLLAQWIITNKLRVGYAVDFAASKLWNYNNGSHEIMVSYEIDLIKNLLPSHRYY